MTKKINILTLRKGFFFAFKDKLKREKNTITPQFDLHLLTVYRTFLLASRCVCKMSNVSTFITVLFLSLIFNTAQAVEELDKIVAVVNEDVITFTALKNEVQLVVNELQRRRTQMPPTEVLLRQVLERMIMEKLQLQLAERTGIRIDDNTLNATLRRTAAGNGLSLAGLREEVQAGGQSFAGFREELRQQIQIKRLHQRYVNNKVNVTEREIDNFLANQARQGNVRLEYRLLHILIAVPEAASPEIIAEKKDRAEDVLQQLKNGADFKQTAIAYSDSRLALEGGDLGWRSSGELPSLFAEIASKLEVGTSSSILRNASGFHIIQLADKRDGEQSIITQTNSRHILLKTNELRADNEAESRLWQIKERIESGQDFAQLAKAHSDDTTSARQGGDLGWVSPSDMVPEFEEEMLKLNPQEISAPFKSRYGWHIVQVLERREHDNTEQARRSKASRIIRQRKIEEELQTWLRQLRDEAYVENRLLKDREQT